MIDVMKQQRRLVAERMIKRDRERDSIFDDLRFGNRIIKLALAIVLAGVIWRIFHGNA